VVLGFCPCGPFRLNISPKKDRKNKINVNCVSHTIVENVKKSLEITSTYNKRLSLSLPGLTFYEIYYPTYSTLSNKRGIFCCENMFRTVFRAGLMSLIIPGSIHLLFLCHERHFMKFMTLYSVLAYPLRKCKGTAVLPDCNCSYYE